VASSSSSRSSSTCTAVRARSSSAGNLDDLVAEGAGFAALPAGEIGQFPSDPDIAAMPDLDSFTLVPWQQNLARFACDRTVDGEPWPYCPRTILRGVVARAKELGYDFKLGLELEYFLVKRRSDGSIEIADAQDTLDKPCYDMAGLTRQYDFLTTVSRYCNELGWGNYANDHEDANGQFEQNFLFDDALVSCDRAIFFRYMFTRWPSSTGWSRLHAEAVHPADRQRLALPHVALARRREPLPRRGRPARARALRARLQLHRRAEDARAGVRRP